MVRMAGAERLPPQRGGRGGRFAPLESEWGRAQKDGRRVAVVGAPEASGYNLYDAQSDFARMAGSSRFPPLMDWRWFWPFAFGVGSRSLLRACGWVEMFFARGGFVSLVPRLGASCWQAASQIGVKARGPRRILVANK